MQRGELRVEGIDDAHTAIQVLRAYGWTNELCLVLGGNAPEDNKVAIRSIGGDDRLLKTIKASVEASDFPIAIMIDADNPVLRWQQLIDRFKRANVILPERPPAEGFVGQHTNGQVQIKVGLWMMPDNSSSGGLEEFLQSLIDDADKTYAHAVQSTKKLIDDGNNLFAVTRRSKAELRAYLAWQDEPGCAYGNAVARKYFRPDRPAGKAFAKWFAQVFDEPKTGEEMSRP